MLRLYLFGAPRIERDGQAVVLRRTKALAMLAYLAIDGRPQERERLLALLWPEFDGASARNNLRRELSLLRATLGEDVLLVDGTQVAWNTQAAVWVDVVAFREQMAALEQAARDDAPAPEAIAAIAAAAELARDELLAGFNLSECPDFDEWQFFQREGLCRQLGEALRVLAGWHARRGDYEQALTCARRWLQLDQLHEPAHRELMRLYALAGQRPAALRQYAGLVQLLASELGSAPETATTALYESLRSQRPAAATEATPPETPLLAGASPAGQAEPPWRSRALPAQTTPFLGREQELEALERYLETPGARLITIVGPGGMGKTRLALELAARRQDARGEDVAFATLQPVASPDLLVAAIADEVGCHLSGVETPRVQLLSHLRDQRLMLVLDNFEHLVAGADLLSELLAAAPGLRLLVTSREVLNLQEEWIYPLAGLPVPPEDATERPEAYAAVRCFAACARRASPDFSLETEAADVARICRLVEGMPLALELAAAWRGVLTAAQIAAEIEGSLAFLVAKERNRPQRHRSVRAVFEHSWARLSHAEQLLFMRLTVFRGGFTHEAAATVAGATRAALATLIDKSLVRLEAPGRYQIHELLRQYAAEQLEGLPSEASQVREAHSAYYLAFLAQRSEAMLNGRDPVATAEIAAERENVRLAWRHGCVAGDIAGIAGALGALASYYLYRGPYDESVALCAEAVGGLRGAAPGRERDEALSEVLHEQAWLLFNMGRLAEARAALDEVVALMGGPDAPPIHESRASDPLAARAYLALLEGDYAAAGRAAEAYLRRSEERGAELQYPFAWFLIARIALGQGLYTRASHAAERALAAVRVVGDRWLESVILADLGQIVRAMGNYALARGHFRASYAIREVFDDPEGKANALYQEGLTALYEGSTDEASELLGRSLALYRRRGDRNGLAETLHGLGRVHTALAAYDEAAHAFGEAVALARETRNASLLLGLLVSVSELLLATGEGEHALELLMFSVRHPATNRETSDRAHSLLLEHGGGGQQTGDTAIAMPLTGTEDLDRIAARVAGVLSAPRTPAS